MSKGDIFSGKNILVTGGSGSFGQAFIRRILSESRCNKVIVFSRDEWKQWQMRKNEKIFEHPNIRYFLGDVRDQARLRRAFNEVDIVIHTAALKQVPAAEYNPSEFVNTNVIGAQNIIEVAIDCGVKRVIALSTDKAVNPVNLYGATKLCSDKLFVAGNSYVGARGYPIFSVVRYGNVLASRGSIVCLWNQMIKEGAKALPVTDGKMTRFWITLEQAVDFVIKSCERARGGEIYIPKIPSMKIVDLAKAVAPELPIKVIGIRPGEKLHELMVPQELARLTIEYDDHYMILPERIAIHNDLIEKYLSNRKGTPVPENFSYRSDNNTMWLEVEKIRKLIQYSKK